jgi:hypothetical protein
MVSSDVRSNFIDLASRLVDGTVSDEHLARNEVGLLKRYVTLRAWPADAQLALHLMAWVGGPGFHLPAFRQAVNCVPIPDFACASLECRIADRGHSGMVCVNAWNRRLFQNAQRVVDLGLAPHRVYFPMELVVVGRRR